MSESKGKGQKGGEVLFPVTVSVGNEVYSSLGNASWSGDGIHVDVALPRTRYHTPVDIAFQTPPTEMFGAVSADETPDEAPVPAVTPDAIPGVPRMVRRFASRGVAAICLVAGIAFIGTGFSLEWLVGFSSAGAATAVKGAATSPKLPAAATGETRLDVCGKQAAAGGTCKLAADEEPAPAGEGLQSLFEESVAPVAEDSDAQRLDGPLVLTQDGRPTLVVPLEGSTDGASTYLLGRGRVGVDLPRARLTLPAGEHALGHSRIQMVHVRNSARGARLRILFAGPTPRYSLRYTGDALYLTVIPGPRPMNLTPYLK